MAHLRENLDKPQRRPNHRIFAVMATRQTTEAASEDLGRLGIESQAIDVLHGDSGVAVLDAPGSRHGRRAQVVRMLKNLGGVDAEGIASYNEALLAGRYVMSIALPAGHSVNAVIEVLERHHAQDLRFFGTGSMETIPDDYPEL